MKIRRAGTEMFPADGQTDRQANNLHINTIDYTFHSTRFALE